MSDMETGSVDGTLHAYHDGELGPLARWRFERRLRRSPKLQRELASLARLGDLVRAHEEPAAGFDVWDRIEQRLPVGIANAAHVTVARASPRSVPTWTSPPSSPKAPAADCSRFPSDATPRDG